jgi:hypothetical protein
MTARSTGVGELLVASSSFNEVSTVKALLDKFGDEILQAKTKVLRYTVCIRWQP